MRPHSRRYGHPGPFTSYERRILQLVATAVAHGFETLRWREARIRSASWQLQITELLGTEITDEIAYHRLLRILHRNIFSGRLLIAVKDHDREQLVGKAIYGGFQNRLVEDTVRRLYSEMPGGNATEDILARVCRLGFSAPILVNPQDPNDPWLSYFHEETRVRHGVQFPLVLVPIPNRDGAIQAVILAETPAVSSFHPHDKIKELEAFAKHAGTLVEFLRLDRENRRRRRLIDQIHSLTAYVLAESNDSLSVLRQMSAVVASEFNFEQAVFYRFEQQSSLLEGVFGIGVNGNEVRSTRYSVRTLNRSAGAKSFAVNVFQKREAVFLSTMLDERVDQIDRDRIGVPPDNSGLGIPLIHDDTVEGVLIFAWRPAMIPSPPLSPLCLRTLTVIGAYIGFVLSIRRRVLELAYPKRANNAKDLILAQVSRLAAQLQSQQRDPGINPTAVDRLLSAITREIAAVSQSEIVGLFLAEDPVEIRVYSTATTSSPNPWETLLAQTEFRLKASQGYTDEALKKLKYNPAEPGMTALVLRTIQARVSPDVEADPRWSKNSVVFLAEKPSRLRTWMGVPLAFREGDMIVLFGALTCTRSRQAGDSREFTSGDVTVLRSIADLISLTLYSDALVARERKGMSQFLTLFRHEELFSAIDATGTYSEAITRDCERLMRQGGNAEADSTNQTVGQIRYRATAITKIVQMIGLVVDAYSAYARRSEYPFCDWSLRGEYGLADIVKDVIDFCSPEAAARGDQITILPTTIPSEWSDLAIDESKTAYIVYSLLCNALKSVETARLQSGGPRPGRIDVLMSHTRSDCVLITVRDNGIGIDMRDKWISQRVVMSGYSEFGGSGLGLAIVQYLLRSHWRAEEWPILVFGSPGEFAEFSVEIPVRRAPAGDSQ